MNINENNQHLKRKVLSGLFWKFAERISAQFVSLLVSIILARLLLPEDYGAVSLVTIFITLANVFVVNGLGVSLIQKKDADNIDFSTVFFFNIIFSCLIYVLLYSFAPIIADFYGIPILCQVVRVLGLKIPIAGINSVQQAFVSREMIFKRFFYSTLIGTIISAAVGIAMAYNGFGVWALVFQYLTNSVMGTIVLWYTVKWRPIRAFSIERMKRLFSYGWKLLAQSLLVTLYGNLRSLVIGKIYSSADLAFYNKGGQFPNLIVTNVDSAINSTLFPAMSKEQSNLERVRAIARRATKLSSYIMSPLLIGFASCASSFVSLVLTDKWLPCVPYLQIICINLLCRPAQTACLQAIKAAGRSDKVLKMDIPVRVFGIVTLLIAIRYGVLYIALTELMVGIFGLIIYSITSGEIVGYGLKDVLKDCGLNIVEAVFMGFFVVMFGQMNIYPKIFKFLLQVFLGACFYVLISWKTHNENFVYIIKEFQDAIKRKKPLE